MIILSVSTKYHDKKSIFSRNLKRIRKDKGFTQSVFALKIGAKQNTVSNYESGYSYPDADKLDKIIEILDVGYDELHSAEAGSQESKTGEPTTIYGLIDLIESDFSGDKRLIQALRQLIEEQTNQLLTEKERVIKLHERESVFIKIIRKAYPDIEIPD